MAPKRVLIEEEIAKYESLKKQLKLAEINLENKWDELVVADLRCFDTITVNNQMELLPYVLNQKNWHCNEPSVYTHSWDVMHCALVDKWPEEDLGDVEYNFIASEKQMELNACSTCVDALSECELGNCNGQECIKGDRYKCKHVAGFLPRLLRELADVKYPVNLPCQMTPRENNEVVCCVMRVDL